MVDAPMRREAFPIALMRYRQRRPASSTSVGELGMTRRISLVAACCSRRSRHNAVARLEFCEQPHVLDCNNVLVGKGLEKVDPTEASCTLEDLVHEVRGRAVQILEVQGVGHETAAPDVGGRDADRRQTAVHRAFGNACPVDQEH